MILSKLHGLELDHLILVVGRTCRVKPCDSATTPYTSTSLRCCGGRLHGLLHSSSNCCVAIEQLLLMLVSDGVAFNIVSLVNVSFCDVQMVL